MDISKYIDNKLTHSLHTSERMSFRACRRRWSWLFHDRWYPTVTPKPLEFGSAFHKAMESWYEPTMWDKDPETRLQLAIVTFVQVCNEQKQAFLKQSGSSELDPEVKLDYEERIELGTGMIRYHCTKVSPVKDVGFKPKAVEIEFEVPITNPETGDLLWCKCDHCWKQYYECSDERIIALGAVTRESWNGLPVTYGGRIDMLAEDDLGRLWIFDWKTAARLSGQEEGDSPDEFVYLEDQITSYLWALWGLGIQVAGFVHHEMKKAFPVEPEPNKTQRKGCWYSVNKMQNTTYDLYLETITEGDPQGLASGSYDDFLDYLKSSGPRFFSRKQVHRNVRELQNAGKNIWLEALEMTDPNIRIYPSPGRFGCTFCAYRQPCLATNQDEDVEYLFLSNFEKRTRRYWEEAKPSTESKGGQ